MLAPRRLFIAIAVLLPLVAAPAAFSGNPPPSHTAAGDPLSVPVRVTDGHTAVTRTRRQMGFALRSGAGPAAFTVDPANLKAALGRIAAAFHRDPKEPRPIAEHGKVSLFPGQPGRSLNIDATARSISDAVAKDPAAVKFDAVFETRTPSAPLARFEGIDGVLGAYSTRTSPNPKRNHNVILGVSRINGQLLEPDQTFSVNDSAGQRLQSRGFRTAPVFVDAEVKPGIGGGISQVTGTLFNAAARANLKIVEVYPHSRPVAYIPVGYDATVAFGEEDLKFKNDTGHRVYIDYRFDPKSRRLSANIFGHKVPGETVRLHANVTHLAPGKIDADLYRIVKINGKLVAKERLFHHHYRWDPNTKA